MNQPRRNIVLVILDSVRQDTFSEFATRLQKKSDVSYVECRAASSWSTPSHASMFTGTLPHEHNTHINSEDFSSISQADTFLDELSGYHTVAVSSNTYISDNYNIGQLFNDFNYACPMYRLSQGLQGREFNTNRSGLGKYVGFTRQALKHERPFASLANGGFRFIAEASKSLPVPKLVDDGAKVVSRTALNAVNEEPYFLFVNFMDAHWPLTPVRGFDHSIHDSDYSWSSEHHFPDNAWVEDHDARMEQLEKYRGIYESSVEYLDRVVADLVDDLIDKGDRETTVVITSDHGDNLGTEGDNHLFGHKGSLTEGLLHVPLVVVNPPGDGPVTVTDYVSHLELPELLVGHAQGEAPDITQERIFAERIGSNLPPSVDEGNEEADWLDRLIRVTYKDDRKYQWDSTDSREVYRLDSDRPNWQEPIKEDFDWEDYDERWFRVPMMEYKNWADGMTSVQDLDEATKDRLEHLGYR